MTAPLDDWAEDAEYRRKLENATRVPPPYSYAVVKKFEELEEYTSASQEKRREIREKVKGRIRMSELEKTVAFLEKKQKNIVYYSIKASRVFLWTGTDEKISFSGNPASYIKKIIQNERVSIKELTRVGTTDKYPNISTTIKSINRRFRKKVIPSENIISNTNDGSGYFLNKEKLNFITEK